LQLERMAVLKIVELHKSFGKVKVLTGINLEVPEGQRHAIIGPNGAGKTTLFHLLSGNYRPDSGRIIFRGRDITGLAPHKINRLGLARSFQITNVFRGLSVLENIRAGVLARMGIHYNFWRDVERMAQVNERCHQILAEIGLEARAGWLAGQLAYGEQRALEIGLALASDPVMLLLDEPTAGMSSEETREAIKLIERISRGRTLLIIEHDMEVVFSLAEQITVINYGEVLASGPPEQIRRDRRVQEAYLGGEAC